jgi:linoleoyl-CoA desaturase
VHYPAVAAIVEETCSEHGVVYSAEPTFWSALASNLRWLREMGRGPALAVVEPEPEPHAKVEPDAKQLRRMQALRLQP